MSTLAQVKSNQTVAVFGAGPVGLLCMAVAKACGAKRVIAIDIAEERLKFAQSYAATDGFMPPKLNEGEERMAYSQRATNELMKALKLEERGSNAVDVVIDASGAEVCIQMGLFLVTAGGELFFFCETFCILTRNVQAPMCRLVVRPPQRFEANTYMI